MLNNNVRLCVTQNGFLSNFFNIGRGCRQGDPVSSYIFNLCAEVMGLLLRQNKDIKGIKIGKEVKLLQYADDTVIFLDGTEQSLKSALDLLFQFAKYSGLKPNINKTCAIWIGSKINSETNLCKEYNIHWENGSFKVLGITFTADLKRIESDNYDVKLEQIQKEIGQWNKRHISPIGKITVIKSLLLSKLTHLFTVLPRPNPEWIKKIESMFYKFIWSNKPDKISRKCIQLDYSKGGGCRMVNISLFIKSLKLTWLRRLLSAESTWSNLFLTMCNCKIEHICQFGSQYSKNKAKTTSNPFWKEFFNSLVDFMEQSKTDNMSDILLNPIWYNPKITIDNKTLFFKQIYNTGFHYIQDLLDNNGKFISYENLNIHNFPFTTFIGLRKAILKSWPQLKNINAESYANFPTQPMFLNLICKDKNGTRRIYDIFQNHIITHNKSEIKWQNILGLPNNYNWKNTYNLLHICTKDTKLIWLQYRIFHRIIGTKKYLVKCKIKTNPNCSFCNLEEESIEHLFFQCSHTINIWNELFSLINEKCSTQFQLHINDILLGKSGKQNQALNLMILLVKYLIFTFSINGNIPSSI